MIKVYMTDVTNLPDPQEYPEILNGLSDSRIHKTMRYRQIKDRKQSLGAGLLLKKCLEEYGIDIEEIRCGEHGKPEIDGIYFNLSHSQDMVVCVVSDKPVGCDIEKIGEERKGIAERFFTKNERSYLESFDSERRNREFYRLWTMKESYIKMTGEGTNLALDRVEFEILDNVNVYRDGKSCSCYIKEYEVSGYKLTVCAECSEFSDLTIENLYKN